MNFLFIVYSNRLPICVHVHHDMVFVTSISTYRYNIYPTCEDKQNWNKVSKSNTIWKKNVKKSLSCSI